ncbi:unnamed protein product [Caenorhabditis auriculariae]|uniref:NADP-dependent oxidoreductase domain-containing protein n=1 Tax=Caenorhabditis auriculariae TaxID=2777116 RepID=A0A8S1HEF2_9PELO|nr:unnamed protein product [Caenorhabditis auriculariae]
MFTGTHTLNDGYHIPMVGLGISRIVGKESVDESVGAALDAGYRLFDTAHIYENEAELGAALKKHLERLSLKREDVFITTKVKTVNEKTREHLEKHLKESLEKLQLEYIDLVLVHYPRDRDTGKDEDYEANKKGRKIAYQFLEEQKENGIIKSIGVSNYEVYHLVELFDYAKYKPAVNQCEFTPRFTRPGLLNFHRVHNIFFQAFSSLCWGDKEILNTPAVEELAKKYDVSPQTILYAFAFNSGVGIIPKSANPTRIPDNLHKVVACKLSSEELKPLFELDRNLSFCPGCFPWRCL